MKTKNGFTLIELLAVIVILAIIALIATPIVLNIINEVKENSFKSTIDSVERAIELKLSKEQLDGKIEYPYTLDIKDLDLDNKENLNGKIIVNSKDDIVINLNDETNYYNGEELLKDKPYIKIKVVDGKGKNIVIDEQRKYIYGFDESWMHLSFDYEFEPIKYLQAVNGTVEIIENEAGTYSTGAKVILKDTDGNIAEEYSVIVFGDIDGSKVIDSNDMFLCEYNKEKGNKNYKHYEIYALSNIECEWMDKFVASWKMELNQFTRKLEPVDWSKYQ